MPCYQEIVPDMLSSVLSESSGKFRMLQEIGDVVRRFPRHGSVEWQITRRITKESDLAAHLLRKADLRKGSPLSPNRHHHFHQ